MDLSNIKHGPFNITDKQFHTILTKGNDRRVDIEVYNAGPQSIEVYSEAGVKIGGAGPGSSTGVINSTNRGRHDIKVKNLEGKSSGYWIYFQH